MSTKQKLITKKVIPVQLLVIRQIDRKVLKYFFGTIEGGITERETLHLCRLAKRGRFQTNISKKIKEAVLEYAKAEPGDESEIAFTKAYNLIFGV